MKSQRTTLPRSVDRTWYEVDASVMPLGRLASEIAKVLRGKHKRDFTPNMDMGDFVVATNVDKLKLTGRKVAQKVYFRHSGYLGGLKKKFLKDEIIRNPEFVLRRAVREMLDDVKFRNKLVSRLKMVKGDKHTFAISKKLI